MNFAVLFESGTIEHYDTEAEALKVALAEVEQGGEVEIWVSDQNDLVTLVYSSPVKEETP